MRPRDALATLVEYFRAFAPSDERPKTRAAGRALQGARALEKGRLSAPRVRVRRDGARARHAGASRAQRGARLGRSLRRLALAPHRSRRRRGALRARRRLATCPCTAAPRIRSPGPPAPKAPSRRFRARGPGGQPRLGGSGASPSPIAPAPERRHAGTRPFAPPPRSPSIAPKPRSSSACRRRNPPRRYRPRARRRLAPTASRALSPASTWRSAAPTTVRRYARRRPDRRPRRLRHRAHRSARRRGRRLPRTRHDPGRGRVRRESLTGGAGVVRRLPPSTLFLRRSA